MGFFLPLDPPDKYYKEDGIATSGTKGEETNLTSPDLTRHPFVLVSCCSRRGMEEKLALVPSHLA
jgi:hypothetical protein